MTMLIEPAKNNKGKLISKPREFPSKKVKIISYSSGRTQLVRSTSKKSSGIYSFKY